MNEYLYSQARNVYPFIDASTIPASLNGVIADISIILYQDDVLDQEIRLDTIGPSQVLFKYADTTTAFSGEAGSFSSTLFGDFKLLTWSSSVARCEIVVDSDLFDALGVVALPADKGYVNKTIIVPRVAFVETAAAYDLYETIAVQRSLILREGYNCQIDTSGQVITVSAVAGAGLGKTTDHCALEGYVLTVNGQPPDINGNVNISPANSAPGACFLVIPDKDNNQVKVVNSCVACCDCPDYVKVYKQIRHVWLRLSKVNDKVEALKARLASMVADWNSERVDRITTHTDLQVYPYPAKVIVAHGWYVNNTEAAVVAGTVSISSTGTPTVIRSVVQKGSETLQNDTNQANVTTTIEPTQAVSALSALLYLDDNVGDNITVTFNSPDGAINEVAALVAPTVYT